MSRSSLWHLTPVINLFRIESEGLTEPVSWGSEDLMNAARFLVLRNLGQPTMELGVIRFSTKGLKVQRSADHSASFFQTDDSWEVFGKVPASAISEVGIREFVLGKSTDEGKVT